MQEIVQRHTAEQSLFIAKCGKHYFSEAERKQLVAWIHAVYQYRAEYENRHISNKAARAVEYLGKKLKEALPQIKVMAQTTTDGNKRLIYAFLIQAVELALQGDFNA